MANSTDFKSIWERYQIEGAPQRISIVKFCQMNGVVYSQYEKWYRQFKAMKIEPLEVLGLKKEDPQESPDCMSTDKSTEPAISYVNLTFSNGMEVHHHNLDYQALKLMIEKLEALC